MDKYEKLVKRLANEYLAKDREKQEKEKEAKEIAQEYETTVMKKARIDNKITELINTLYELKDTEIKPKKNQLIIFLQNALNYLRNPFMVGALWPKEKTDIKPDYEKKRQEKETLQEESETLEIRREELARRGNIVEEELQALKTELESLGIKFELVMQISKRVHDANQGLKETEYNALFEQDKNETIVSLR